MIESFGPRPVVPSGPAASLPAMQAGEKIVHRPEKKVLPTEKVDRTAQTGPRPAFQQTYLEQLAAFWPEEPDPPVTHVDYDQLQEEPRQGEVGVERVDTPPAKGEPAEKAAAALPTADAEPTVDIRA